MIEATGFADERAALTTSGQSDWGSPLRLRRQLQEDAVFGLGTPGAVVADDVDDLVE
jgi:hypothetical protein